MREVVATNIVNQDAFKWIQREKTIMEAKLRSINVDYSTLKDQAQGFSLELGSCEITFKAAYKQVVPLRQELEAKASQAGLQAEIIATQAELLAAMEEVWCFQAKLQTLRDSFQGVPWIFQRIRSFE